MSLICAFGFTSPPARGRRNWLNLGFSQPSRRTRPITWISGERWTPSLSQPHTSPEYALQSSVPRTAVDFLPRLHWNAYVALLQPKTQKKRWTTATQGTRTRNMLRCSVIPFCEINVIAHSQHVLEIHRNGNFCPKVPSESLNFRV